MRQRVAAVGEGMDHEVRDAGAGGHADQRVQVVDARMHATVGHERRDMDARRAVQRRAQHRVAAEVLELGGLVDQRQVLLDDGAGAEVEVTDLRVAHLPVGQADRSGRSPSASCARSAPRDRRTRACAASETALPGPSGARPQPSRTTRQTEDGTATTRPLRRPAPPRQRCGRTSSGPATRRRRARRRRRAAQAARRALSGVTEPP